MRVHRTACQSVLRLVVAKGLVGYGDLRFPQNSCNVTPFPSHTITQLSQPKHSEESPVTDALASTIVMIWAGHDSAHWPQPTHSSESIVTTNIRVFFLWTLARQSARLRRFLGDAGRHPKEVSIRQESG